MSILDIVVAASLLISPGRDRAPEVETRRTLEGIASAVENELEPVFGSKARDAVLATLWSWHESRWRTCVSGDHGRSWGAFQEQTVARGVACDPEPATVVWLGMARSSVKLCGDMTALASGSCGVAKRLVSFRMSQADRILRRLESASLQSN